MSMNVAGVEALETFGGWGGTMILVCVVGIIVTLLVWWFSTIPSPVWACPHCHKRIKNLEEARRQ